MPLFTLDEVLEITGARLLAGDASRSARGGFRRISTDSRDIRRGDLFVALVGDRFDGKQFVQAALDAGAAGALVQAGSWPAASGRPVLGAPDSLLALQQLAAHHRSRFEIPVVAVTGSNGKTTTKEMVACVLAQRGPVLKTEGNLNNRIGVPLTLLRLAARQTAAVIEMGVDHRGQTTRLCEIAHPTVGLITNIGPDHLEFFGSVDVSAQAKGELLDCLPADGAVALNADDAYFDYLASRAQCRVVSFGLSPRAQVRAVELTPEPGRGTEFRLVLPGRNRPQRVLLPSYGVHNVSNALAAAAVGHALGLSGAAIARGLERFKPAVMRSDIRHWKGLTVIDDAYNANPASMEAAITLLAELAGRNRSIAVLGDMLELGPESPDWHRRLGQHVAEQRISRLIVCGELGRAIAEGARQGGMAPDRIQEAADSADAGRLLRELAAPPDAVLVKGSRGMAMERALGALTKA